MESTRRDFWNDVAEHMPVLKNNQNTYHPRFGSTPKSSTAFPKTWVLFLLWAPPDVLWTGRRLVEWKSCHSFPNIRLLSVVPSSWRPGGAPKARRPFGRPAAGPTPLDERRPGPARRRRLASRRYLEALARHGSWLNRLRARRRLVLGCLAAATTAAATAAPAPLCDPCHGAVFTSKPGALYSVSFGGRSRDFSACQTSWLTVRSQTCRLTGVP